MINKPCVTERPGLFYKQHLILLIKVTDILPDLAYSRALLPLEDRLEAGRQIILIIWRLSGG